MRACLAVLLVLLGAGYAIASPFDQVPLGDTAYADGACLVATGIIDARTVGGFSGKTPLTRYDFAVALARPASALEGLLSSGRPGAALSATERMARSERIRVANALSRLIEHFGDVLALLGTNNDRALRGARMLAKPDYHPLPVLTTADNGAALTYRAARARLGLDYRASIADGAALPYIPLGALPDAPVTGVASPLAPGSRGLDASAGERVVFSDIALRRVRGSLEYAVSDNLTLDLAVEALVREGRRALPLDFAALRTLGVGYRLSPSTSVKLQYHLVDYAEFAAAGSHLVDRVAAGELTIKF